MDRGSATFQGARRSGARGLPWGPRQLGGGVLRSDLFIETPKRWHIPDMVRFSRNPHQPTFETRRIHTNAAEWHSKTRGMLPMTAANKVREAVNLPKSSELNLLGSERYGWHD